MKHRYSRLMKAKQLEEEGYIFTDFCNQKLSLAKRWASANLVYMSTPSSALVTQTNGKQFAVDLNLRHCGCGNFSENGIPCGHALSVIQQLQRSPHAYIPNYFLISTWKQAYTQNLSPISLNSLPTTSPYTSSSSLPEPHTLYPPTTQQKPRGRPKVNRYQAGSQRKKAPSHNPIPGSNQQACSLCLIYGHKRSTCPTKPRGIELDEEAAMEGDV